MAIKRKTEEVKPVAPPAVVVKTEEIKSDHTCGIPEYAKFHGRQLMPHELRNIMSQKGKG